MNNENILLQPSELPFGAVPFDKLRETDYAPAVKAAIELHKEEIARLADAAEAPTFANTVVPFEKSWNQLNTCVLALSNLEIALGTETLMAAMAEVSPLLSAHTAEVYTNEKLWQRIGAVEPDEAMTAEDLRLLEETKADFIDAGADLEEHDRARLLELKKKLSDLTVKFGQNVSNEMQSPSKQLWLTRAQLEGLPADIVEAARHEAIEAGRGADEDSYLFTVFAPSYIPFMKYQANRELRRRMYELNGTRNVGGEFDNTAILKEIANTRLEISWLMGYDSYATFALRRKMARSPLTVMSFLDSLREAYMDPMRNELKEITDFARQTEGCGFELQPWDYSYWANRLRTERYAFDDQELKPYFELDSTIAGVFGLATKLYGYTFEERRDLPLYHPDVRVYEVKDSAGATLGLLYADFFYRGGKSPGAWMTEFRAESKSDGVSRTVPLISIVCNFSKPVAVKPVLLTASEVNTFLHEFGHALHGLSADTVYASMSGTNVRQDFVELFSQFNENYLTQKEFLDTFAKHYQTGEQIPADLLEKFVKSSQFAAAYACVRQLGFGYLDMAYYSITEPLSDDVQVEQFECEACRGVETLPHAKGCIMSPSFGHIFSGGYAAGYYGYKWAEVLDADAFDAFREEGLFNPDTARRFRKMLSSGGTVEPMDLYVEFRGKQPTVEALMRRDGILARD